MLRTRIALLAMLVLAVAGCKTGSSLAERDARAKIESGIFMDGAAIQTAAFSSGAIATQPLAIDQYLFSKHWTTCVTEAGALASSPRCSMDDEGSSYGHTNHWTVADAPTPACAKCATWTIPIARAKLSSVGPIDVKDDSHATAPYTYAVVPNEFGRGFGEWTASNPVAWCGADPAAVGGWGNERHATASFVKTAGGWNLADQPGTTFVATFANDAAIPKPCAR